MARSAWLAIASWLAMATWLATSCSPSDTGPASIWTDVPELSLAVELFNSSQDRHLAEVRWMADMTEALRQAKPPPALAMGRFLKGQGVRDRFQSLDYLFGELVVNQASFYPGLLALGNVDGRQLLLPVSFNLPAIVFARDGSAVKNDFVLGLEDIAASAAAFNQKQKGAFTRMGFSPRWNGDFLTLAIDSAGAGFKEGRPLAWNEQGLGAAIAELRGWASRTNGSAALEDDFGFKYLYTPAYQYVSGGRALYAYLESDEFFLIPEEKRAGLDFRWYARGGAVPVSDGIVYAAILRGGSGKQAAEAFLKWFFKEDTQKAILESARSTRALESSFGIAGGFSAVRSVNEKVFPRYYPSIVGHLPPAASLAAPNVLPSDWAALKEAVVAPWLAEATGRAEAPADPGQELADRIADYKQRTGN
jgi:hypothetical protein